MMTKMIFEEISETPPLYRCPEWRWNIQPDNAKGTLENGTPYLMVNAADIGNTCGIPMLIPVQIETGRVYRYECTSALWAEAIEGMNSGEAVEVDEEFYWYFLEVLPPIFMNKYVDEIKRRVDFGFAEGYDRVRAFWKEGSGDKTRYFCKRLNMMNPYY